MKHTPGPWFYKKTHDARIKGFVRHTEQVGISAICRVMINSQTEANGHLIAAAPELLEIAIAYRNLLKTMAHSDGEVATYEHIQSVIAKGTGEL